MVADEPMEMEEDAISGNGGACGGRSGHTGREDPAIENPVDKG